jgi:hypothetical protein
VSDERTAVEVTADVRARHAEMMAATGGTGRPEDYRDRLSFILPFLASQPSLLVFCGCCQAPLFVETRLGLWVGWQKNGGIAPLCAVCLDYLNRREETGDGRAAFLFLPEYDFLGQRHRSGLETMSPVELAQLRMAEMESLMPVEELAAHGRDVATVAREAFLETAGTLNGLEDVWRKQRPDRLRLGRAMIRLQATASPESLEEFDGLVREVPGTMRAFAEAQIEASGGAPA